LVFLVSEEQQLLVNFKQSLGELLVVFFELSVVTYLFPDLLSQIIICGSVCVNDFLQLANHQCFAVELAEQFGLDFPHFLFPSRLVAKLFL
jgi:hypothetical protein